MRPGIAAVEQPLGSRDASDAARGRWQAFGAMFKDATVLNGMVELSKESWAMVAREHDLPPPEDDDVQRAMGAPPARPRTRPPGARYPDAHARAWR